MGTGQIGGIATLMDIDFENAAGFVGKTAESSDARYLVFYLSHALMFCTGALVEAHIVLTPAICTTGESLEFEVIGGTHKFLEFTGVPRTVTHTCVHTGFNKSSGVHGKKCSANNVAILVLEAQYQFNKLEKSAEYVINRIRYGSPRAEQGLNVKNCHFYGFGSRRSTYIVPQLINLRKVEITVLEKDMCAEMWNQEDHYLCLSSLPCISEKYGALCPDDVGSVVDCDGFVRGLMTTRLLDRPCGTGYIDMNLYLKFLTCAVDGARDMISDGSTSIVYQGISIMSTATSVTQPGDDDDLGPGEKPKEDV